MKHRERDYIYLYCTLKYFTCVFVLCCVQFHEMGVRNLQCSILFCSLLFSFFGFRVRFEFFTYVGYFSSERGGESKRVRKE